MCYYDIKQGKTKLFLKILKVLQITSKPIIENIAKYGRKKEAKNEIFGNQLSYIELTDKTKNTEVTT